MSEVFPDDDSVTPVEIQGVTFNEFSYLIISRLLHQDKKKSDKTITEKIKVISQESAPKGITQSILISKKSDGEAEIRITSRDGVDVVNIQTKFSPQKICDILQRASSVPSCPIRISSQSSLEEVSIILRTVRRQTWIIENINMPPVTE
jgi:hypothetical protein